MRYQKQQPHQIIPLHDVNDERKLARLTKSMAKKGWVGQPLLVWDYGDGTMALTGSHRLAAAMAAQLDEIPVIYCNNDLVQAYYAAQGDVSLADGNDDDRGRILRACGDDVAADLIDREPTS